ncbi:hypothetical protein HYPSUDRAFT_1017863 [Hypholoma sublateritium FD-334 SS-4]|uniref:ABM domain-containing protein n=1 Tax=Hypholoma sublateritium (strain FD-334 SS-4) TaxID=945553 RepID=A0A0D2NEG8_HYPSF|nr:hypothetical protein HYPSUDRAFT_1017863 [Hypholoma sublateritium FD-334 SS-4]
MPSVEVVSFTASPALLADIKLADGVLDYLKNVEGCISIVKGYTIEEPTKVCMLITWDSYESYESMTRREDYGSLRENMKLLLAAPPTIYHVDFDVDISEAVAASFTEIAVLTPKEGYAVQEVTSVMKKMQGITAHYPGVMFGMPIGQIRDVSGSVLILAGWVSLEAPEETAKTSPFAELVADFLQISDLTNNHVSFSALVL